MYDLLIQNAFILDGTGTEAYQADLGIKNGRIAKIAPGLSDGKQVIDASGLTVSPGFIDSHSHSDRGILSFPDQKEKVEQGITVSIVGQCGGSIAPAVQPDGRLQTLSDFMKLADATPQGSGAAILVGFNSLRRAILGTERRVPTPDELEKMKALLREAMEAGAIGMSLGLLYVPGCYAKTDEVIEMAKVVGEYGGLLASHLRDEGDFLLESVQEFLQIIRASGCRGVFSHHKAIMRWNWGKVKDSLAMIDAANQSGLDVYLDVYPYCASSTTLAARYVPPEFHPEGTTSVPALLDDPEIYDRVKKWGQQRFQNDLSWTMVNSCPLYREYEGMNLNEIADLRGDQDRMDTALHLIRETDGVCSASFFMMCEEDLADVIAHPRSMPCTDSASAGKSTCYHPRLRASFPRMLGRYAREKGVVTMPEMIRKMTSLPAHVYGLSGKGKIAEGMDADLCIFNADTIIDRADFRNFSLPNEGLAYVIIDGKIVLEDGKYNGNRAAKVIRKKS
ncbi:MAG: D-aminoacylase [Clostridia bacterium]|nr:D-aminoacylase [Clostridia bacterium]